MHSKLIISLALTGALSGPASALSQQTAPNSTEALTVQAQRLVQRFADTLKPRLVAALEADGPAHAINVCASEAPGIAAMLSRESGWQISRVSLKPRNQQSATPDDWERQILQQFEARQAVGEPAGALHHAEVLGNRFRYLQAQGVEPLCLSCHGQQLSPSIAATLEKRYPDDQATGYELNQIRGAFSLSKPL